jgi:hypothetical protein
MNEPFFRGLPAHSSLRSSCLWCFIHIICCLIRWSRDSRWPFLNHLPRFSLLQKQRHSPINSTVVRFFELKRLLSIFIIRVSDTSTLLSFRFQSSPAQSFWQQPASPVSCSCPAASHATGQREQQHPLFPAQFAR